MPKVNKAVALCFVLSIVSLALVIFGVILNKAAPLSCKIFTGVIQIPGWGSMAFLMGQELKDEMAARRKRHERTM